MKVKKFINFIGEKFSSPKIEKDKLQELIKKAKKLVPKENLNSFIENNKDEIKKVTELVTDSEGNIDYS